MKLTKRAVRSRSKSNSAPAKRTQRAIERRLRNEGKRECAGRTEDGGPPQEGA